MDERKKARLETKGWKVGTVAEFLGLTPAEATYVEIKLALSNTVRQRRDELDLTQVEFAKRIRSSQSHVAKMETGDPSVSVDLLIRALLALEVTGSEIGDVIAAAEVPQAEREYA